MRWEMAASTSMIARHLIRQARRRAGLTQAELAANAATTQSAVARWESGGSTPSVETLQRIVEACGLELRYGLAPAGSTEWSLAQRNMALDYEQRLDQLVHGARRPAHHVDVSWRQREERSGRRRLSVARSCAVRARSSSRATPRAS